MYYVCMRMCIHVYIYICARVSICIIRLMMIAEIGKTTAVVVVVVVVVVVGGSSSSSSSSRW